MPAYVGKGIVAMYVYYAHAHDTILTALVYNIDDRGLARLTFVNYRGIIEQDWLSPKG